MPQYWTPLGGLSNAPQGIGISNDGVAGYPNFYNQVSAALQSINAHAVGQALITGIIQRRTQNQKYMSIKPPRNGGDANEAQSLGGDDARTALAKAIGSDDYAAAVEIVRVALNGSGHQNDYNWLATQLNAVPRYTLQGNVAAGAGNYGILALDVERWLQRDRPLFNPFRDPELAFIQNALQVVVAGLNRQAPGSGSHSVVFWNPTKTTGTLSTGAPNQRPAFVGLAHEMIHAYHNLHGTQLSWSEDSSHSSTVLYEYMCVGLGPWAAAATPTENAIRTENAQPTRALY
jgi:Effector protein